MGEPEKATCYLETMHPELEKGEWREIPQRYNPIWSMVQKALYYKVVLL